MRRGSRSGTGRTDVRILRWALGGLSRVSTRLAARAAERLFFTPPRRPFVRGEHEALRPAAQRWLAVGRHRIRTYAWGQGPVVVLVHGWGGGAGQMAVGFAEALVRRGFRVVAFDGPGHGASSGRISSIPEFGRALLAVLREYGPVQGAVGHSLGAAAVAFALTEGLAARHVALIAPAADPARWTARFADSLGLTPEVMAHVRVRAERRLAFRWEDLPMPRLLAGCALPVLVVHDRDDREVAWREAAQVAEAAPRGTLVTTRGLGHRRILQDPEVAAIVADFVAGRSLGERAGPPCGRRGCAGTAGGHGLCDDCALEADLFDPGLRRVRLSL